MQQRDTKQDRALIECPPVPPALVAHLDKMFSYPIDSKVTNPQLSQLLMIQYGVEKVLNYLKMHYDQQSQLAREKHAI